MNQSLANRRGNSPVRVAAYDSTGKLISVFDTVKETADYFGVKQPNVSRALREAEYKIRNIRVRRVDPDTDPPTEIEESTRMSQVAVYDLTGKLQFVSDVATASKRLGASVVQVYNAAKDQHRRAAGHVVKYVHSAELADDPIEVPPDRAMGPRSNSRTIERIDPKTDEVLETYPTLVMAAKAMGTSRQLISAAVEGKVKIAKGFKWNAK